MRKKLKIILLVVATALTVFVMWQFGVFSGSDTPKVCLDAGHGGSDVGAEFGSRYEKDDNLKLTLAVGEILKENGIKVIYTRTDDKFVELEDRAAYANKKRATFFVSIHRNSANTNVSGVEIWIKNTAPVYEEEMAKNILDKINEIGYGSSRGVKRGYQGSTSSNYLVNSATDMPSCLVEMGFITTEKDNELFDENFDKYAQAIANGIIESVN